MAMGFITWVECFRSVEESERPAGLRTLIFIDFSFAFGYPLAFWPFKTWIVPKLSPGVEKGATLC